jgi:hypothetical protein
MDIPEASRSHDTIWLVLPDGREVIGRALIVQNPIIVEGGGNVQSNFALDPRTPEMQCCVVLMKLDAPIRKKIVLS